MTKKTRKKRKISPIKKAFRKKNLAKNFIILLVFILVLLSFGYFVSNKAISNISIDKKDNILNEQKKYSNEEVMNEIISNLGSSKEILIDNIKKLDEKDEYEKSLKQDISDDVIKKVEQIQKIEESKKEPLQKQDNIQVKTQKEQTYEIKDEIIEDTKPQKVDKKNLITAKDKYKHDINTKPKLVIIIDDVVSKAQKDKILDIGYPVTMSFLPPTSNHKDSAKISTGLPFYMIHFPMQASKAFKNSEIDTLDISDSYERIESRVKNLREWYPNAIYTNNHTGSVFTENYEAMDKLFKALKKYSFIFVDSKTTPNSVAKELSVKYQTPYIVRDIFLDNDRNFLAIQNQLKSAIKAAKKNGYAIAIGHPYDITIKVLKESKHLLNDVEPIFLNKLPYL